MFLLLGKTLAKNGSIERDYEAQISMLAQLLRSNPGSFAVISGGVTRPNYPSEARVGFGRIPDDIRSRVTLEEKAMSTRQNIEYVRELVRARWITQIIVVSSTAHSFRVEYLFWKYWPEAKYMLSFSPAYNSTIREWLLQIIIYGMIRLDPNERVFLRIKRAVFS